MSRIVLNIFVFITLLLGTFSCSNTIDDMPQNIIEGKWQFSHLAWDSVGGNYKATREAIQKDLRAKWSVVEPGAFTYEFRADNIFIYSDEVRGNYQFTGSGAIISSFDPESDKYSDEGSLQFKFIDGKLMIIHNFAHQYRNKETNLGDHDILQSIGVTTNLESNKQQHIYGAWVGLVFDKIK